MENALINPKGQILIPRRLRSKYRIEPGKRVLLQETSEGLLLKPVDEVFISSLMGILPQGDLAADMRALKEEELALEEHNTSGKPKARRRK